jgi:hypothetical protein
MENTLQITQTQNKLKIINVDDIDSSTYKTKKKSFVSEINPREIRRNIQREGHIWFGVYDELMRNKFLINEIKKCKDNIIPSECAAIHLQNFKLAFCRNIDNTENETKAYIFNSENSIIFLKLYLITKDQFYQILSNYYKINLSNISQENLFLKEIKEINSKFDIPKENKTIINLGELDSIFIYSISCSSPIEKMKIAPPEISTLRNIYLGLKRSFHPYSEYLIMYYIYRLDGVRNFLTLNQLKECFFKLGNSNLSKTQIDQGNVSLTENHYQYNNNQHINQHDCQNLKDNETVKCSTCNASPYVGTPEKDQLNQFSYILDLHYLPVFDENTGEFIWSKDEKGWKHARDSILKSEDLQHGKSISINHGNLISLTNSFLQGGTGGFSVKTEENDYQGTTTTEKWQNFKSDANSGTFIEELNNLLKDLNI